MYGEQQGDGGEAQILKRQENNTFICTTVIHKRPLQAGHGQLFHGDRNNVIQNTRKR